MRIIDWSSDVCSSDLQVGGRGRSARKRRWPAWWSSSDEPLYSGDELSGVATVGLVQALVEPSVEKGVPRSVERPAGRRELGQHLAAGGALGDHPLDAADLRSEEHTSELPSLMRSSYAVFCLKKHKKPPPPT